MNREEIVDMAFKSLPSIQSIKAAAWNNNIYIEKMIVWVQNHDDRCGVEFELFDDVYSYDKAWRFVSFHIPFYEPKNASVTAGA